ncbi:hypothetical protein EGR_10989 [Echinococcus granulosus]|uniref:Uncharacterized protein n=1 Tax=Echinococcus granulosus TaxID=6210 RepID=W6TZJ8_ECHGR|nr:hypothetical protein EGR_10989 [Echinococcus granulosus]EUB54153.1 hypothetical protein EGR_10989 [Echinococcus granulosus]
MNASGIVENGQSKFVQKRRIWPKSEYPGMSKNANMQDAQVQTPFRLRLTTPHSFGEVMIPAQAQSVSNVVGLGDADR